MQFGFSGIKLETICTKRVRLISESLVPNLKNHTFIGNMFYLKPFFSFLRASPAISPSSPLTSFWGLNHAPPAMEADVPDMAETSNKLYQFIEE